MGSITFLNCEMLIMNRKKRVMILGASRYYVKSIMAAKEMGCTVIVTDKNQDAEGFKYADFFEAVDITNIKASIAVAKKYHIDGIVAVNDFGVQTAAAIAESLSLPGIGTDVAKYATSKAWMRRIWEEAGVPSAKFEIVHSVKDAYEAVDRLGMWPLIVKPADSRGGASRGVSKIEKIEQLKDAVEYAQSFYESNEVVIEEFLDGIEHSIETLTYDGVTHIIAVSDKEKTPPPYRVDKSVIYPTIYQGLELQKIHEAAILAVKALGIELGAAHVEMCSTKDGPKLFELGARCGGGGTPGPIIPFLTGVEMFKEVVRMAIGEKPRHLEPLYTKGCVYRFLMPKPGIVKEIIGLEEVKQWDGILDCEVLVKKGETIREVKTGGDRAGFIIAGADNRENAVALADRAEAFIKFIIA